MGFNTIINNIIKESNILIETLDARLPELSRNKYFEKRINEQGKLLIFVINKIDIFPDVKYFMKNTISPVFFVSSRTGKGIVSLKKFIIKKARELLKEGKDKVIIGIFGYPNVGKSSLINSLSKKGKTLTSPTSGFTKGKQILKMRKRIYLLDSPGIIPIKENDEVRLALLGSKDVNKIKELENVALVLIELIKEKIKKHYDLTKDDSYELLEELAEKLNYKKKGNKLDTTRAAKKIIKDWQEGTILLRSKDVKKINKKIL